MRFVTSAVATLVVSCSTLLDVTAREYPQEQYLSSGYSNDIGHTQPYRKFSQSRQYGGASYNSEQRTGPPVQRKLSSSFVQDSRQGAGLPQSSYGEGGASNAPSKLQYQGNPSSSGDQKGEVSMQSSPQTSSPLSHQSQPSPSGSEAPKAKSQGTPKAKGLLPGLEKLGIGTKKQGPLRDNTLLGIPLGDKPKSKAEKAQQSASRKDADKNSDASLIDAVGALFQNFRDPQEFKTGLRKAFSSRAAKDSVSSSHFKQRYTMDGKSNDKVSPKNDQEAGKKKAARSLQERGMLSGLLDEEDSSILDARDAELQARSAEPSPIAEPDPEAELSLAENNYDAQLFGRDSLVTRSAYPKAFAGPEACASAYGCAHVPVDSFAQSLDYSPLSRRNVYIARKALLKREIIHMLKQRRYASEDAEEPKKKSKADGEEGDDSRLEEGKPKADEQHESESKTIKTEATESKSKPEGNEHSEAGEKKAGDGDKRPQKHPDVCDACKKTGLPQSLCKMVKICQ